MNEAHGLIAENLLRTLPEVLRSDKSAYALASAIAEVLAGRPGEIEALMLYNRIDRLPESLLDILAIDFKVDWWSPDYSLEDKRATLKDSWKVHRKLGTKYALEQAISDVYPQTTVQEWWEYGGNPYCFRIMIGSFDEVADPQKLLKIRRAISQVKRLSAHLDGIDISSAVLETQGYVGGAMSPPVSEDTIPDRRETPHLQRKLLIQAGCADYLITAIQETDRTSSLHKQGCGRGGFALAASSQLPGWEDNSVYCGQFSLSGRTMTMTEMEVLHL